MDYEHVDPEAIERALLLDRLRKTIHVEVDAGLGIVEMENRQTGEVKVFVRPPDLQAMAEAATDALRAIAGFQDVAGVDAAHDIAQATYREAYLARLPLLERFHATTAAQARHADALGVDQAQVDSMLGVAAKALEGAREMAR